MLPRLLGTTILAVGLAHGAAFAGDKDKSTMDQSSTTSMDQSAQNLPQEFKDKLKAEGFTDVEVVPGSYFISAKDKNGDRVHALISPNSLTVVTMDTSDSSSETTGSASSDDVSKSNDISKSDRDSSNLSDDSSKN